MRILLVYLRVIVISLEFVIFFTGITSFFFLSDLLNPISLQLKNNSDIIKHIALVPSGFVLLVFKDSRKLLFPTEDNKNYLQAWHDYWKWKIHFEIGLGYSIFFALIGLMAWSFGYTVTDSRGLILLATPLIGSSINYLSIYMARIKLAEIFLCKN